MESMPTWMVLALLASVVAFVLLVWAGWREGAKERAKLALKTAPAPVDPPIQTDQEYWAYPQPDKRSGESHD